MKFLFLVLLLLGTTAQAQENSANAIDSPLSACESEQHHQFDFWIGEWDVTSNGQPAGTNSVHTIQGGCALKENWQGAGPGGISGTSFNVYDQANDQWHQTWVDSSGTLLLLDGALIDGKMVLTGKRPNRDRSELVQHRITWTPNEDGTVRQLWEASTDDGATWNVLFDGLYTPQSPIP